MLSRLSAGLVDDLSPRSVLQTAVLLLAAWWVWVLTAWLTDLFNPRLPLIQALVLVVMFGTLVMAVAVPRAFEEYGFRGILRHPSHPRRGPHPQHPRPPVHPG